MKRTIISEVQKKWSEIGKNNSSKHLELEIELYKKLLNIFQAGDFYYFIFNPSLRTIDHTSQSVESVLGYKKEEFTIDLILEMIHPDDLPFFVDFETAVVDFKKQLPVEKIMKYKSRYNYRIRKKNGDYLHILQQSVTVQIDEDGAVIHNMVFHTDISDIATSCRMKLSFIGLEGEPSYIDVQPKAHFSKSKAIFSEREKEILQYIIQGLSSEQISQTLNRSIHTIHVHRKNILRKSGCETVNELLIKSIREGWV